MWAGHPGKGQRVSRPGEKGDLTMVMDLIGVLPPSMDHGGVTIFLGEGMAFDPRMYLSEVKHHPSLHVPDEALARGSPTGVRYLRAEMHMTLILAYTTHGLPKDSSLRSLTRHK
jgi:hypothetical protein